MGYVKLNTTPSININFCCLMVSFQTIHLFTCRTSSTLYLVLPVYHVHLLYAVSSPLYRVLPLYHILPPILSSPHTRRWRVWLEYGIWLTTLSWMSPWQQREGLHCSCTPASEMYTCTHTKNRLNCTCMWWTVVCALNLTPCEVWIVCACVWGGGGGDIYGGWCGTAHSSHPQEFMFIHSLFCFLS